MQAKPSVGKPVSEKPIGYIIAVIAGTLGGPIGWVTSPLVLFILCKTMHGKGEKQPNRFLAWAAIGVIGAPLSFLPFYNLPPSTEKAIQNQPTATVPTATPAQVPAPTAIPNDSGTGVTMANYLKLQTGMTYEQVAQILGDPGEELSSTDIAGIKGKMYMWKAQGLAGFTGSNMNATFQNNMLTSKAQFGLP
jgi:hypothetical protein